MRAAFGASPVYLSKFPLISTRMFGFEYYSDANEEAAAAGRSFFLKSSLG